MVILQSQAGQLGNRLWQASYFIANAIENEYELVHLGFGRYYEYFSENIESSLPQENYRCKIYSSEKLSLKHRLVLKYKKLSDKFNRRYHHQLPFLSVIELKTMDIKYDLSKEIFTNLAKKNILFADGWPFVDYAGLRKHAEIIRKVFTPDKKYMNNVQNIREAEFCKYDKVIGVHIRRGDYANFLNGRWFYSFSDYSRFMKDVAMRPEFENLRLGFVVCSDEPIDQDQFKDFNIIASTSHFLEDLYLLACCDLIIGPPSSYSCWAAFYGNTPLIFANHHHARINNSEVYHVGETFPY